MANGEGGKVGIHPDLGRGGFQPGEAVPKGFQFQRLGQHLDVGQLGERGNQTHGIKVGETLRAVGFENGWRDGEAQKALLGGPAEAGGTLAGRGGKDLLGERM